VKNLDSSKVTSQLPTPSFITEKLIDILKRWTKLEAEQKDLDFRRSQLAKEARECFPDDERFIRWCQSDLGVTYKGAQELCLRAKAASVVPDAKTWSVVGGFRSISAVKDLPKREQINVLQAAKASGRGVRSVYNERYPATETLKRTNQFLAEEASAKLRAMQTAPRISAQSAASKDLTVLAKFIADNRHKLGRLPPDVLVIVMMYAPK
jgi:hypothetical protein